MASATAGRRLGYVDGLRALAALEVVGEHINGALWQGTAPAGVPGALVALFSRGHTAVSVFIVISGFSLMLPVARNADQIPGGAWSFYKRRAWRILPPYYLALALSLLLIWLFIGHPTGNDWDNSLPVTWQSLLARALLLQDFTSPTNYATINYVFWSIAMECQIYVVFPALVLFWRRYQHPLFCAAIVTAVSIGLLTALIPTWIGRLSGYGVYAFAPQYIGLFAMGMFAASILTRGGARWEALRKHYFWDMLALACWAPIILDSSDSLVPYKDYLVGIGTIALLLAASRLGQVNPLRAALEWRPLVWIGGFSYSLYLIHAPLIQLIWQYGLHPLGLSEVATYLALLLIGAPLIVLAAWGFWYVCERPFLNSSRAIVGKKAPSPNGEGVKGEAAS